MNAWGRVHGLPIPRREYALLLRRRGGRGDSERAETLANEAWKIAAELDMVLLKRRLQPKDSMSLGRTCAGQRLLVKETTACRVILSNGPLRRKSV